MIDGSDLTILVLCYNEENTIFRILNSIRDLEIVGHTVLVSDNHSTDSTAKKLKKALSNGMDFRLISPPIHIEMSEHFNYAFSKVKTKYVYPIQGHHIALPDGPGSLLKTIQSISEEPALVFGCMYFLEGEHLTSNFYFRREGIINTSDSIPISLFGSVAEFTKTIYDVEKVRSVGGFETKYHRTNLWQLHIKLEAIYPIYYLRRYISIWSIPPPNIRQKSDHKAQIAQLEIPIMIQDMIDRLGLSQCDKICKRHTEKRNKISANRSAWVNIFMKTKQWIKPHLMHVDGPSPREVRALVKRWSC